MAIVSENRIEWLLTQMGAGAVGAVAVGVYATSPAEEMGYVLEHADIELVVRGPGAGRQGVQVADRLPGLRRIVVIETKGLRSYAVAERARIVTFAQVEEDGQRREDLEQGALDAALDGQRLADIGLMIYTRARPASPRARC